MLSTPVRRRALVLPGIAVAVVLGFAIGPGRSALGWLGAAAVLAVGAAAVTGRREGTLMAGHLTSLCVAAAILTVSGAGLANEVSGPSWRPVVAVAAYPLLGHLLVRLVAAHRHIREPDVLVEAALVGTAAGIVVHVAANDLSSTVGGWASVEGAFPAMLLALDVALLTICIRSSRAASARRGPMAWLHLALVSLLGAHVAQVAQLSQGRSAGAAATGLALLGLLAVGVAGVHPAGRVEPDRVLDAPALFSPGHAGVVVVALLAAPAVLAAQALRGLTASPAVATGAVLSGSILACYLVGLLRERASTEHEATHDGLTGLPNRRLLVDRLERSIAHARRHGASCGVLFVDLDRFKEINDTFGHAAGDGLLRVVARRLRGCVRDEDTVARLSGDEFVLLLPHLAATDEVIGVAQRVLDALGEPVVVAEQRMLLAGSVGIAVYPEDGLSAAEVLASADAAMYRAKETPGSRWEVFSSKLATQAQARLRLEAALLDGLLHDELVLHYQPIVDVGTGRTIGAEALVRWNHPERGFLLPGHFVPIAEQSDLIVLLGERVIEDACRELRRWEDLGLRDLTVSVNVSSRQFDHGLVSTVAAALRTTRANPSRLQIELTENTVVDNVEAVAATLEELRSLGVRAAIDDFGTGYCGLRYLSSLPFASLKIDRSFIQGMTPSSAAIVTATIAMGHSLGLTLVAEGVETEEQRRFLAQQGCDRVQGFLLGRPMPADELVERLRAERAASCARASERSTASCGVTNLQPADRADAAVA